MRILTPWQQTEVAVEKHYQKKGKKSSNCWNLIRFFFHVNVNAHYIIVCVWI